MPNANLTPKMILKQFMAFVKSDLIMIDHVHRDYDAEIANRREGDTIYVRAPMNFTVQTGTTFVNQDIEQREIPVTVDTRKHIGFTYSDDDFQLSMPEFVRKHSLQEAARAMATDINRDLLGLYDGVYNWVGAPGQLINSMADWNKSQLRLDLMDVPAANRFGVVSSEDGWSLVDEATSLNAADEEVIRARRKGMINRDAGGAQLYRTSHVRSHTVGNYAGTPLVNGASQDVTYAQFKASGQTLETDGWSSGSSELKKGDVFTIAGVFAVHPNTKDPHSHLQQFVVKADVSDTGGAKSISIDPAIITSGPYQTVSAAPADNAAITVIGTAGQTYKQNLAFHKNAFLFTPVPIKVPDSAVVKASVTDRTPNHKLDGAYSGTGLTFTMVKDFNIDDYSEKCRIDVLYGKKVLRPELAVRCSGTA